MSVMAYTKCMWKLSRPELEAAEAINAAAFANPFTEERKRQDERVRLTSARAAGRPAPEAYPEALFAWVDRLRPTRADYRRFEPRGRDLMRTVFLFDVYHRHVGDLDRLIEREIAHPTAGGRAAFAAAALARLREHGFPGAEAGRFFAIFYQLRRAHYFIVRGLRGAAPCMHEFRRRLWNNVFTSDVRWYDRYLWDRMEDFSTLLLGETGAGKGAAAAAIGRSGFIPFEEERGQFVESFQRIFIAANLAQYPETLLEAELFGYRKGAFTGAVENYQGLFGRCSPHGAVFLDELGEIGFPVQVKLLQVLQDRTFTPVGSREPVRFHGRIVAATNRRLSELRERRFRDDFFYRLTSDIIEVPSLRQRLREDPSELAFLLQALIERMTGEASPELVERVASSLEASPGPAYAWPGNVRELEQAIRRILITGRYDPRAQDRATEADPLPWLEKIPTLSLTADQLLAEYCRLAHAQLGTRAETARRLGLDPRTVERYLRLSVPSSK